MLETVLHGYQDSMQNDNLFKFVYWYIRSSVDAKYKCRHKICETVKRLGKQEVLDELSKQIKEMEEKGESPMTIHEAVIIARTIRDCE